MWRAATRGEDVLWLAGRVGLKAVPSTPAVFESCSPGARKIRPRDAYQATFEDFQEGVPMKLLSVPLLVSPALLAVIGACGGSAGMPATSPDRPSGQSSLMDKTFAGANKCDAKNHNRPFIIEWDATDM